MMPRRNGGLPTNFAFVAFRSAKARPFAERKATNYHCQNLLNFCSSCSPHHLPDFGILRIADIPASRPACEHRTGRTSMVRNWRHVMHATVNGRNTNAKPQTAEPKPQAEGRDAKGRFAPGNAGGPGNPF